jgi:4-aminobutyrate aminotransferase/(S)-3-amino-2-methylpropionate transaminase
LQAAVAGAVLDVIESEGLCEKARAIGKQIGNWAEALQAENNCIGNIRITGAMSAIELVKNGDADSPDAELTREIAAHALADGVLLLTCGVRGNVIRFLPPLTIEPEVLGEALDVVGDTIRKLTGEVREAS